MPIPLQWISEFMRMKRARTTTCRGQRHWRGRGALHARAQRPPCSVLQQRCDLCGRAPALRLLADVALCCSGDGRVRSSCSGRQGLDGCDRCGRLCGRQRLEGRCVLGQRRCCSGCGRGHLLRCSGCLLQVTVAEIQLSRIPFSRLHWGSNEQQMIATANLKRCEGCAAKI